MAKAKFEDLSSYVVNLYTELESDILINIAKSLKGKNALLESDPEAWKLQMLENVGMLYKENLQLIKKAAGLTSAELNKILISAGLDTLKATDAQLEKAKQNGAYLLKVLPPEESPIVVNILKAYETHAKNVLNITNQTLIHSSKQAHIDIINKAAVKAQLGFVTSEQALRSVIGQWAEKGMPALIDRAGRRWGVEGYVRTVMMTTANNVSNELQDARIEEYGIELIEVTQHAGDRPGCAPYAGRIFSLKPNHEKYPYLYDPAIGRIGDPDSLFGINCGHMKFPFIEGISVQRYFPAADQALNKKIYEQSQQQRAIERSIRKAKTRLKAMEVLEDAEGIKQAKQLIKARQLRMRKFINTTGRTRRYDREQIVDPNKLKPKVNVNADLAKAIKQKPVMPAPKPKAPKQETKTQQPKQKSVQTQTPKQNTQPPKLPTLKDVSNYKFMQRRYSDVNRDTDKIGKLEGKTQRPITTYTGGAYEEMNNHLRFGKSISPRLKDAITDLKKTLPTVTQPLTEDIILRRNMGRDVIEPIFGKDIDKWAKQIFAEENIEEALEQLRKRAYGAVATDKGFVSTTYGEFMNNFKRYKGVEYRIYAKKGSKHGLFVESISNYPNEMEYLMNAGQKFRVFDVTLEKPSKIDIGGGITIDGEGDKNIIFHMIPID